MPKTSIKVQYKFADDWHVFFSDDLAGLYVASKNPRKALKDVVPAIEQLIELDGGVKVRVEIEPPMSEFLTMLNRKRQGAKSVKGRPGEIYSEQRYSVFVDQ